MNVLLIGSGAMGSLVREKLLDAHTVTMADSLKPHLLTPPYEVIIDFSHPDNLEGIIDYVKKHPTPLVIATTGYSEKQIVEIQRLGETVPVLFSANFSLGVILMNRLVKEMASILADSFDIEVIEKHHHLKVDAPSGTARMLVDSLNGELDYQVVHGREGMARRRKKEIGVHTIRGGSIVGEHEVLFAGADEIISIKHEALSKSIFATGAIRGARWLVRQDKGLYDMEDVLFRTVPETFTPYSVEDIIAKAEQAKKEHSQ